MSEWVSEVGEVGVLVLCAMCVTCNVQILEEDLRAKHPYKVRNFKCQSNNIKTSSTSSRNNECMPQKKKENRIKTYSPSHQSHQIKWNRMESHGKTKSPVHYITDQRCLACALCWRCHTSRRLCMRCLVRVPSDTHL